MLIVLPFVGNLGASVLDGHLLRTLVLAVVMALVMTLVMTLPETVTPLRDNEPMENQPAKIVMFADLHLERQFSWAEAPAASRRRLALRQTLTNVVELAVAESADAIFCGGDLYEDDFFSPDLMHVVASTFDCGIPVLVSPGNHDHLSPSSLYARAALPDSVHVFSESRFSPFELAPGLRVWGAAHTAHSGTAGFFDCGFHVGGSGRGSDSPGGQPDVNLALFHGSERGGFAFESEDKFPHAPFDAAQIPAAGIDYAFVGHHHRAHVGDHHTYPGNPDPLEFGEDGPRGAVVATVETDGAVAIEHHSVNATVTHSLTIDVTGCAHSADVLSRVTQELSPCRGFVRADLVGQIDPDVEIDRHQLQDLGRDFDGFLVRTNKLHRNYVLDDIANEDASIRAHFVRLVRDAEDMTDEDRHLILELGLRAFDNRRDLEVV